MERKTDRREYLAEYDKQNTRQIKLKLNTRTDADVLEQLDRQKNIQGYIKQLIRNDIKQG